MPEISDEQREQAHQDFLRLCPRTAALISEALQLGISLETIIKIGEQSMEGRTNA